MPIDLVGTLGSYGKAFQPQSQCNGSEVLCSSACEVFGISTVVSLLNLTGDIPTSMYRLKRVESLPFDNAKIPDFLMRSGPGAPLLSFRKD